METTATYRRTGLYWLWISCLVIVIDQLAKYSVTHIMDYNTPLYLLPILNFTLELNTGAAFSFLSHGGQLATVLFIVTALIISVILLIWLYRLPVTSHWLGICLALLLGGAIGNLIDRVHYGYVIDFIHFHLKDWNFAVFNFADVAITIGTIMLIMDIFLGKKK